MNRMKRREFLKQAGVTAVAVAMPARRSPGAAQQNDNTSCVPRFTFADTLEKQEAQLRTNPLVLRFKESRKRTAGDPHRPIYHYVNPEHRLNDPNGLCYWRGRWHLFYQAYPPEDPRQHVPVKRGSDRL